MGEHLAGGSLESRGHALERMGLGQREVPPGPGRETWRSNSLEGFWSVFSIRSRMKPESIQRGTNVVERPSRAVRSGIFRRGRPTRELFLVRFSFRAVVVGLVLLIAFVLWGLATHGPSQNPWDSGD